MKFKILPKVHAMRINRIRYMPGSIVDLPESYRGTDFLQEVPEAEPLKKVEPAAAAAKEPIPAATEASMEPAADKDAVARHIIKNKNKNENENENKNKNKKSWAEVSR